MIPRASLAESHKKSFLIFCRLCAIPPHVDIVTSLSLRIYRPAGANIETWLSARYNIIRITCVQGKMTKYAAVYTLGTWRTRRLVKDDVAKFQVNKPFLSLLSTGRETVNMSPLLYLPCCLLHVLIYGLVSNLEHCPESLDDLVRQVFARRSLTKLT